MLNTLRKQEDWDDVPAGQHTMYIRRAFEHVQTQQKPPLGRVMLVLALLASLLPGMRSMSMKSAQAKGDGGGSVL